MIRQLLGSAATGALLALAAAGQPAAARSIQHVLLLSIDGMHAVDLINCANGIAGVNGGKPYCPNLAALQVSGTTYLGASTSKPSDSFPGLMSIMTGGSPRTFGAFYDVAYDRSLDAPKVTTGNGLAGGSCQAGAAPTGSTTEFDEGIDINQTKLNGGAPSGDGGIASIDAKRLDRDPANNCAPVYPWNFIRTNTIFGVIHNAGGYTAWSDKHPAYSSVSGPGSGGNVNDYYSPEINSIPVALPRVVTPSDLSCDPLPDQTAVSSSNAWTDSFQNIQCYDTLKVDAIVHEINGKTHNGAASAPRPTLLGMNFQAVSVGQKLIEKSVSLTGGYVDATGTPTASLLSEIKFVDDSVGKMVAALQSNGIYDNTLIVISAKHGQSPIDSARYTGITANGPVTTSPATILQSCLPFSESPANANGIGPTEDDVSLLWLSSACSTAAAVNTLEKASPASANIAGIGQIFWGTALTQMFNTPGLPPGGDPRTPDIIVTPNIGVTYSGSTKKLAEHGGFAHDDTNVLLLVENPGFYETTINAPVQTAQIAPTILRALGLNPTTLDAVRLEGTPVLPGIDFSR